MGTKPDSGHRQRLPLTRQRIAEAALRVIDLDGLNALTMKRLGSELGVEAMSLYFHFSNKEKILDEVVDLLFSKLELPEEANKEGHDWAEVAQALFLNLRRHLLNHPNAVSLFATRPVHSVGALAPIEASLRNLRQAGFDESAAIDGHRMLMSFMFGYVVSEVPARSDPASHPEDWGTAAYALQALPTDQVPNLAELAPVALSMHSDDQFDRCLGCIITALRLRLEP